MGRLVSLSLALPLAACNPKLPPSSALGMHDPTPQAKCSVAVSKSEPLVTEWPASQKSRLESLLSRGAVVVSYSGCEMRVLDACSVKGSYAYTRTTLATDTVEISDEDDLYAKLPLGAVRLAADLQREGRLAVRTTVAGQFSLNGATVADVPVEGECASATHLVTGLAIGAFKLLAGGKLRASAGGSVGPVGNVGGSTAHEEMTLTEAGDPASCASSGDTPNPNCKSPIQVFLRALPNRAHVTAGGRTEMAEEKPPTGGVRVNFKPSSESDHWSLLTKDDKLVCDLPCTRWIGPSSGMSVQLDANRKQDIVKVPVPADLGYSAGRKVDATPRGPRGSSGWAITMIVVGGTAVFAAPVASILYSPKLDPFTTQQQVNVLLGVGIPALVLLATGIGVAVYTDNNPALDITLASSTSASFIAHPGFLGLATPSGQRIGLTSNGFGGSF